MGTDIHVICQVKDNGKWIDNPIKIFPHYDFELKSDVLKDFPNDTRDYDWFSVLANVRNGRGFSGIKTGDGFSFISEPRLCVGNGCILRRVGECGVSDGFEQRGFVGLWQPHLIAQNIAANVAANT